MNLIRGEEHELGKSQIREGKHQQLRVGVVLSEVGKPSKVEAVVAAPDQLPLLLWQRFSHLSRHFALMTLLITICVILEGRVVMTIVKMVVLAVVEERRVNVRVQIV